MQITGGRKVNIEVMAEKCIICGERYKGECQGVTREEFDAMKKTAEDELNDHLCQDVQEAYEVCTRRNCAECDVRYHCELNSGLKQGDMEGENGKPVPKKLWKAVEMMRELYKMGYPPGMASYLAGDHYGYTASIVSSARALIDKHCKTLTEKAKDDIAEIAAKLEKEDQDLGDCE